MNWAKSCIPSDPLFKQVSARKPETISDEDLEELGIRCDRQLESWRIEDAKKPKEPFILDKP